jgi:hypothetical protein
MVAGRLGFVVESVGVQFPDCLAKRKVSGGVWQQCKIEFEFQSRNYRDSHPKDGCDVIVCWEHNWLDCLVEVIELRSKIETLREPAPKRGK